MKKTMIVAALMALVATGANAKKAADSAEVAKNKPVFTVVKQNPITSIKDQNRSGTCWAYSTLSYFESEILKKTGKTYDLSEMFVANKTYMDRATVAVRMHGDVSFSEGGSAYDVKNIYGIKEATGSLERATAIISQRENFFVFSGDDSVDFAMLASGAKGIISVTSNLVPNLKSKLVSSVMSGDFQTALKIHNDLFELNKVLFCESNPIPIKAAMYLSGLLDSLEFRLPLTNPSNETLDKLEKILKKYEVVK